MADYLTTDTELTSIASAIRSKGGTSATLVYPSGFISAIQEIQTVGTYQSKVVSPTESQQVVSPDSGYDALSSVTVNAISSTYIGTGIAQNSASDLVVDGAVVTVPSGYYATAASASTNAGATYTCTIIESSSTDNNNSVKYNNTYYKTTGDTFTYHAGDIAILNVECLDYVEVYIDHNGYGGYQHMAYEYTLPNHNIEVIILSDTWSSVMMVNFPTVTITENGIHAVDSYYYADVNVYPSLQSKTEIIPTESSQIITADSSYYGLSSVQINAISSNYVGSNIPSRTASNLSASGSVVTVPSGYYAAQATKAVSGGTATTPAKTINVMPTVSLNSSTGVVSIGVSGSSSITPTVSAGYVSTGTAGTVSVSGSSTLNLTTKAAESYGLSGSTRTIPSGTYLTGDQTILPFRYSGISSETIKYGTVVKVGDSEDDDRMISITGGFTGANYVSTGQTAAKSSQILEGYSAWVNGNEVKGNITTKAAATITPTESEQTAVAAGKYTMGAIKVAAINSNYVGSNVPQRASTDLTASGSIVAVPSGYYAAAASKAITAGSVTINSPTITANPTVTLNSSTGIITATVNNNTSIGATLVSGYISTYTGGTAQASGSKTLQLTTKSASTYTPSSTTQTIASGQYLTGVQTIAGDSNLVAANIASGVTIFGITGIYTGETYVAMTTQEIWEAAASGWGSTNPSMAAAIWNSVAAGWSISATMTDSTIHTSVASGWR